MPPFSVAPYVFFWLFAFLTRVRLCVPVLVLAHGESVSHSANASRKVSDAQLTACVATGNRLRTQVCGEPSGRARRGNWLRFVVYLYLTNL